MINIIYYSSNIKSNDIFCSRDLHPWHRPYIWPVLWQLPGNWMPWYLVRPQDFNEPLLITSWSLKPIYKTVADIEELRYIQLNIAQHNTTQHNAAPHRNAPHRITSHHITSHNNIFISVTCDIHVYIHTTTKRNLTESPSPRGAYMSR